MAMRGYLPSNPIYSKTCNQIAGYISAHYKITEYDFKKFVSAVKKAMDEGRTNIGKTYADHPILLSYTQNVNNQKDMFKGPNVY